MMMSAPSETASTDLPGLRTFAVVPAPAIWISSATEAPSVVCASPAGAIVAAAAA
jgi:hypothetical protein